MSETLVIPVDLVVKRYYRIYVRVPEDTPDVEIGKKIMKMDLNAELTDAALDPSIEIEADDVTAIDIDHEGEWTEEND